MSESTTPPSDPKAAPAASNPAGTGAAPASGTQAPAKRPSAPQPKQQSAKQRKVEEKAHDPLRGSRSSGFYASVVALAVVLVLLIIFILQNTQTAAVHFLGWTGKAPASVVLLIAAAAGLFLALAASSLRIFQLRRRVKRDRKS